MFLTNKLVYVIFIACLFVMAVPYIFDMGDGNIFINDYYSKRLMSIVILPLFVYVFSFSFLNKHKKFSIKFIFYVIWVVGISIVSLIHKNSASFFLIDFFIFSLPVLFYLLVNNTNFDVERFSKFFPFLLLSASIVLVFGVKLQFSYFTLLVVGYVIFIFDRNIITFILLILLPAILIHSLIGKNSIILLSIIIAYFFFFDRNFVTFKQKMFLFSVPLFIILMLIFLFSDRIENTGAFVNSMYFFNNTNILELEFNDHSTSHRLFEVITVCDEFLKSPILYKLFGQGFGSTIDLSNTIDSTISKTNNDISEFRVIHLGFFAVLHKLGLIGLIIYLGFLKKMFIICKEVLNKSLNPMFVLMALYVLIILVDSLISFSHMMSNFMFWLLTFIIIYVNQSRKSYVTV